MQSPRTELSSSPQPPAASSPPPPGAWHSLDLAVTRFSGRPAQPVDADRVTREPTHEVISFGFWPGDDNIGDAAYYFCATPEPDGLCDQPLSAGAWVESGSGSLAIFPCQAVRTASKAQNNTAGSLPERRRGRCPPRRLGHH
jgi:hypothetical protein